MTTAASPTTAIVRGRTVRFTCHMAVLSGDHPRNSIEAIRECLDAGVDRLEIDVHSLDGQDYAVFHDRRLETHTTGSGSIGRATPDDIRAVRFTDRDSARPPLLSEVVEAARGTRTQLQLDLKDWRPMPRERIRPLIDVVEPVHDQVIVTTGQDWNLARLHREDPEMAFGFDPGHYLDHGIEGANVFLPRSMGAYGYRDDSPLAFGRTEAVGDYLRERMEQLVRQSPGACEHFLSYRLVLQMLDDGFDPVAFLHERDIQVTAWTVDYHGEESLRVLERLVDAGVDRVTTNTAVEWVGRL